MGSLPMLTARGDFAALQQTSKSRVHRLVVARFLANDLGLTRFGFSTGRRLGGAVARNRVRRRLREIVRALVAEVRPGWDILLIARPGAEKATYPELRDAVRDVLRRGALLEAVVA